MNIFAHLLAAITATAVPAAAPDSSRSTDNNTESACSFMLSSSTASTETVEVPGLSVLHPPADKPHLKVDVDLGGKLEAVICWRSIVDLGPSDDWAVSQDVPLYIKQDIAGPNSRILSLEITPPGYRVRVVSGPAPDAKQVRRIEALLEVFNRRRPRGT